MAKAPSHAAAAPCDASPFVAPAAAPCACYCCLFLLPLLLLMLGVPEACLYRRSWRLIIMVFLSLLVTAPTIRLRPMILLVCEGGATGQLDKHQW
jgi:hypothetical protein